MRSANTIWSDQRGRLSHPLGAWLHPLPELRFRHFAYIYRRSLFICTGQNTYATFRSNGANYYRPSSSQRMRIYAQLLARARPAEVEFGSDGRWKLQGQPSASLRIPPPPPSATATFDLFVQTLDPWETDLLRQTILNFDPFSLCLELTSGIRAVSDGSVIATHHGSFGWVLSSLNGERLAFGRGPVRGRMPHSFRAEAYALLSLLRFLIRVKEFTGMHEPWVGVLATDTQSVLDTLQIGKIDPQEADTPIDLDKGVVVLDCLRPDWDILIKIQHALQAFHKSVSKTSKDIKTRNDHIRALIVSVN